MKHLYRHTVRSFEKLTYVITSILSNSITFMVALGTVIFWFSNKQYYTQDLHHCIGDAILGITFISMFIIQKSFARFSASIHLKVNELLASHESASNAVISVEDHKILDSTELSKEYEELAKQAKTTELPDPGPISPEK